MRSHAKIEACFEGTRQSLILINGVTKSKQWGTGQKHFVEGEYCLSINLVNFCLKFVG